MLFFWSLFHKLFPYLQITGVCKLTYHCYKNVFFFKGEVWLHDCLASEKLWFSGHFERDLSLFYHYMFYISSFKTLYTSFRKTNLVIFSHCKSVNFCFCWGRGSLWKVWLWTFFLDKICVQYFVICVNNFWFQWVSLAVVIQNKDKRK